MENPLLELIETEKLKPIPLDRLRAGRIAVKYAVEGLEFMRKGQLIDAKNAKQNSFILAVFDALATLAVGNQLFAQGIENMLKLAHIVEFGKFQKDHDLCEKFLKIQEIEPLRTHLHRFLQSDQKSPEELCLDALQAAEEAFTSSRYFGLDDAIKKPKHVNIEAAKRLVVAVSLTYTMVKLEDLLMMMGLHTGDLAISTSKE